MRRIVTLAAALLLAGCASQEPVPTPQATPGPAPKPQVVHSDLIGATAGQLIQLLGQPALQVREGAGLKLQFRGRTCVLDAFLYPQGNQGERVTYVDARLPSGTDVNTQQCIAAQLGR